MYKLSAWVLVTIFVSLQTISFQGMAQEPDSEAMVSALSEILELSTFVDANVTFCEDVPAVQEAANSWYAANTTEVLTPLRSLPDFGAQLSALEAELRAATLNDLATRAVGREAEWCANVPVLLQSDDWNVQSNYAAELALLRDFVALVADDSATPSAALPRAQVLTSMTSPSYAQVVAAGIDPERQFIPSEFRCYEEEALDYSQAQLTVQISGAGQYQSSYGAGTFALEDSYYPDIEWLSGPLTDASSSLSFDEFGQSFYLNGVDIGEESFSFDCYQQGASEQRALSEFRLKEPQLGSYQCRDAETGEVQSLELLAGNQYRIGTATGSYALSELLDNGSSSRIDWLTGPFTDESSYYSEEEDTGFRDFSINVSTGGAAYPGFVYSSSELALTCESVGEPVSLARYGTEPAPPAPGSELPLDGFYYRYEFIFDSLEPQFYRFFPDGYVFIGTPEAGSPDQIDCSRTKPNGAPFCATYSVRANTLYITDEGEVDENPFSLEGGVPVIDDEAMTPVSANAVNSLNGLFWANYFSQTGFCGEFSSCSSTYLEWNYDFKPDGSFVYATSSQNLSSMDTALGSSSASGYGNSANIGRYEIGPHSIELRYDNGKIERFFMFIQDAESFVMGEQQYTLKDQEDTP